MSQVLIFLSFLLFSSALATQKWFCNGTNSTKAEAIASFKAKTLLNPLPAFEKDPYSIQTKNSTADIQSTLKNKTIVCGLGYNDTNNTMYELKTFDSKQQAEQAGFIVTHQGRCGACSSAQDLAVYLEKPDLTSPVRWCAMKTFISDKWAANCLKDLGFSQRCAEIWVYNAINTKKHCKMVCLKQWITGADNNEPDGSLNPCLQCDEDQSGPVFKYFAGRTRRDSGLESSIHRPANQGRCGACSSTQDLAVYLEKPDLTSPVRWCAMKTFISDKWATNCLKDLGFSERCAEIWVYNAINTKKHCKMVCLKQWITGADNNEPDGSLNPCIQCDEDQSGPVFKYFAGRTRRDSGLESSIHRPANQVYNMTHCYF